jgi:3-hydroxybutyryl-CoA dehydratase
MLVAGTEFEPWVVDSVQEDAIRSLAQVLADPNPIHLNVEVVQAMGLGDRVINQGPAGIGYLMNMLRASAEEVEIEEFNVSLSALIFAGDHVVARGRVDEVTSESGKSRCRCSLWLEVEGRRVIEGTATIVTASGKELSNDR